MTTESDEDLALEYLGCKPDFTYVEQGSDRECECRRAISRLLRSNGEISPIIRFRLVALFDPDHSVEARHLVIRRRRGGGNNQASEARDIAIARLIASEVDAGHQVESAVALAVQLYGVSRPTAYRAWSEYGAVWITKDKGSVN